MVTLEEVETSFFNNYRHFGRLRRQKYSESNFRATILLPGTQGDSDLKKAGVLSINGINYVVFFVEVGFDGIFEQNNIFHCYFHTFFTKMSSKRPESIRKYQRKPLFGLKNLDKTKPLYRLEAHPEYKPSFKFITFWHNRNPL